MPAPHPRYEDNVPKDCCRVRSCNEEGQEYPGQRAKFPYASPTYKSKGVVKRKPVFAFDEDFTYSMLEPIFQGLGGGADFERLSEPIQKIWCTTLDLCDIEAVDYEQCEEYAEVLMNLCNRITEECTGHGFQHLGLPDQAYHELEKAWKHFVRLIWLRDPEWENLVRYLSDPNGKWSVDEEYYVEDPSMAVRHAVSNKLMVPLQVWGVLLQTALPSEQKVKKAVHF